MRDSLIRFFKPTVAKVVIFLAFMAGMNYWLISTYMILDGTMLVGTPLGFYPKGSTFSYTGEPPPQVAFSYINFIINLVFWYCFASMLSVWHSSSKKWNPVYLVPTIIVVGLAAFVLMFSFVLFDVPQVGMGVALITIAMAVSSAYNWNHTKNPESK